VRGWLDRRELNRSRARAQVKNIWNERSIWNRHVQASPLADMAVESIRVRDVEDFAVWLRQREAVSTVRTRNGPVLRPTARTISAQVQRHVLRLVRQCLDEAVRSELLPTNPTAQVRVRAEPADIEEHWLRADEIDALLGCEKIPLRNRTAYACALGLALRLNDLNDVHLDAQVPGPHVRIRISKSDKPHRVPVLPWLEPWIRAHLATLPEGCEWLFPTLEGRRYGKHFEFGWAEKRECAGEDKSGKPRWRRTPGALERAGVKRKIRFHDLRDTCATHLALGT
jgi:integrase